jgi:TonB-linked SusC/RagA family outer membrane protein
MNKRTLFIFLIGTLFAVSTLFAQDDNGDMIRGKLISDTGEELIGANILEVDKTDRTISHALTDINGDFSMRVKNPQNRLKASYIGFATQYLPIGTQRTFKIVLKENSALAEVVITARKTASNGGMDIPVNEISYAMQKINPKVFEGIQVNSIDDALQGQIAGLDIVGSGNIGQGSAMRIRGTSSISANTEPLIVINNIPREDINTEGFEFGTANEQQFADLLSLHPDDIEEITVLKDAASTAIWGSKGANGVLMITTKKGVSGPTRVNYTYKFTGSTQPPGIEMLDGNEYTMLMKQAYFNPKQDAGASDIPEFSYDPTFPYYQYYNKNTNWREAVIQPGATHDHYLSLSGGGEKARFRVTAGYLNAEGTVIGQKWDRWTSNSVLDYNVSSRISFGSEVSFTYMNNDYNWTDEATGSLLDIAYKKMPNMAIYTETGEYFAIPQSNGRAKTIHDKQKELRNPVAQGNLATNNAKSYTVQPTLRLKYNFFDPDEGKTLRYDARVSFRMNTDANHKFLPKELTTKALTEDEINKSEEGSSESFNLQTENSINWQPLAGETHSLIAFGAFRTSITNTTSQGAITYGIPSSYITDASAGGRLDEIKNSLGQARWLSMTGALHYAYMSKYIIDLTVVREGSTRFGKDRKWGTFPALSLRWNLSDEPFMDFSNQWLDMFSIRPSWGVVGNSPTKEYMHFSQYKAEGNYANSSAIRPDNIRLSDLRWEKKAGLNFGTDLAFLDYTYSLTFDYYRDVKTDILFADVVIPSSSGYPLLLYSNGGAMKNEGWDFHAEAVRFVQFGDFSLDFNMNLAQSVNTLLELDESLLNKWNGEDFSHNADAGYLGRLQEGNAYGSIYGFRYKGVYQYNIESYDRLKDKVQAGEVTMPVVRDANGKIIEDSRGNPLPMYYNFGLNGKNYRFQGGDAMYEDVNHDGNIDELDIVYLGNSNPLLNGGFGLTLRWKRLSCKAFFNFRYGYKIINQARREAENMYNDYNQSKVVNLRWRKEGDVTNIPRALHEYGYNWLPSDRFVEDGSFLRFKYLTFNYSVPSDVLRKISLKQLNIYLTFNNLLCFTNYTGVDPEVGIGGLSDLGRTIDKSTTPRPQEFTLGISVGF